MTAAMEMGQRKSRFFKLYFPKAIQALLRFFPKASHQSRFWKEQRKASENSGGTRMHHDTIGKWAGGSSQQHWE